jgi:hypothetical protein
MKKHRIARTVRTCLVPAALVLSAGALIAGPLAPPAGPIASSYKTLSEVEPRTAVNATNTPGDAGCVYRISQHGSYYLTGNIFTGPKTGIVIDGSGVTLDLNGFEIIDSQPAGGSFRDGVTIGPGCSNVTVRNGSIRSINWAGIYDQGTASRFEDIKVSACGQEGIYSEHPAAVSFCSAYQCGTSGFRLVGATILHCTAEDNGNDGFLLSDGAVASFCTSNRNTGSGFDLTTGHVSNCSARQNTYGYYALSADVVDCYASDNNSGAIRAEVGCMIRGNQTSTPSGFANILLTGWNNRVEGNQTGGGTSSVTATAGAHDNLVIGNSSYGASGTAFNVPAANNQVGPIVTATGTITSTSPFANFAR